MELTFSFLLSSFPLPPPKKKFAQKPINFDLEMLPGSPMDARVQLSWSAGGWMVSLVVLFHLEKIRRGVHHLHLFIHLFLPPLEESAAETLL